MRPAVLSVVGRKGSGRSGVIEGLISNLKTRGLRIGLIKHLSRPGVEIDQPGKDTYRYRQCGAQTVILSGQSHLAVFSDLAEETPLEQLLPLFKDYDLVLLEGYFLESIMKIEVHREELGSPLTQKMENVLSMISSTEHHQISNLASLVEEWMKGEIYV